MTELKPINEVLNGRGHHRDEPELTERDELVLELVQVGIGLRKAENLVSTYPAAKIRRQLRWLPFRAARRPASLLIAAIENEYDAPPYASQ